MVQRVLSLLLCALSICFSADASPKQDSAKLWQRNSRSTSASKIMNSRTFGFLQW